MLKSISIALFVTIISVSGEAKAQPLFGEDTDIIKTAQLVLQPEEKKEEKPKTHIVKEKETLTTIAEAEDTTAERLFAKNKSIEDPDVIVVGQKLTIPQADEKLKKRGLSSPDSKTAEKPLKTSHDGLLGSIGYAKCGGNCVKEPGVNSPHNGTNPTSWPVLSTTPTIGATALWTYNHTGVVTGIWSNGDIEVRHQNYCGKQHRFPLSAFRGFR